MEPSNRKPLWTIVLTDKTNKKRKTQAGALWEGQYGMSMSLNPGIVIDSKLLETCWINLYPYQERREPYQGESTEARGGNTAADPNEKFEDLPF